MIMSIFDAFIGGRRTKSWSSRDFFFFKALPVSYLPHSRHQVDLRLHLLSFTARITSKDEDAVTDDRCHLMDTRAPALAIHFSNTKTVPPSGSSPSSNPNFILLSSYESGSAHSRLLGCSGILISFFLSGIDTDCPRVVHMS